eukprot:g48725.t1
MRRHVSLLGAMFGSRVKIVKLGRRQVRLPLTRTVCTTNERRNQSFRSPLSNPQFTTASFLPMRKRPGFEWEPTLQEEQRRKFAMHMEHVFAKEQLGHIPNFENPIQAYRNLPTKDLVRSVAILKLCSFRWLVVHSESLLALGNKIMPRLTEALIRRTFFAHFVAGEGEESIKPRVNFLKRCGVGTVLDYAAESDVKEEKKPATSSPSVTEMAADAASSVQEAAKEIGDLVSGIIDTSKLDTSKLKTTPVARVYAYKNEKECNFNRDVFLKAVRAVKNVSPEGFAAIKMTALGNPMLLERISSALFGQFSLLAHFDKNCDGKLDKEEFIAGYRAFFKDSSEAEMSEVFNKINVRGEGIDFLEWTKNLNLETLLRLVDPKKQPELSALLLDKQEIELMKTMKKRLRDIIEEAHQLQVRVMIDAEHTYFQPAIDCCVLELQRIYNRDRAVVFQTYQAYLKDSHGRLRNDLRRAQNEGFWFAAKLVRGAYMVLERERAQKMGYPSPIHSTLEDTHQNYHRCLMDILDCMRKNAPKAELFVASHNQASVTDCITYLDQHGMSRDHVYFGQLLGMADHLTFGLGAHGYKAYKYVPYGPLHSVMPYLIRRAIENSNIMGGATRERKLMMGEIRRRMFG